MSIRRGRSDLGRDKRQAILDYLNRASAPANAKRLLTVTGEANIRTMVSRLQRMTEHNEVKRESRLENGVYVYYYTAAVKKTCEKLEPTQWALEAQETKQQIRAEEARPVKKKSTRGRTVHYCDDSRRPIQRQGGQGAGVVLYTNGSILNQL